MKKVYLAVFATILFVCDTNAQSMVASGKNHLNNADTLCCQGPKGLKAKVKSDTSASLSGKLSPCGIDQIYQLQYKAVSSGIWTILNGSTLTVKLKTLSPATTYEWKVALVCQKRPQILSAFTPGPNFTTLAIPQNAIGENSDLKISGHLTASIFPNPATNSSVLRINNTTGVSITINDLTGKMLWQVNNVKDQQVSMPVDKFAPGIYLVTVTNGKEIKVIKLVKE